MKRLLDICVALGALIVLFPIILVTALISRLVQGSPVLFSQPRPGKDGKIFVLRKFRTMKTGDGSDEARLTGWGSFLRKTTLDELPQLWNILKGDMSLVGPRPLLVEYLPLYSTEQGRRHDVRPGLTGWAQVKGRNSLSWEEKFEYDIWYVENQSFFLDLKIIFLTFVTVLARKGINQEGSATMERFTGSQKPGSE